MSGTPDYDIAIVGAGMVGASLVHALKGSGLRIALIEAVPRNATHQPSYDERHLALSLASQRILDGLGLWSRLAAESTPIRHIHVSDQHRPGTVRMSAAALGVEALGHVVPARVLGQALMPGIEACCEQFICPASVTGIENGTGQVRVGLEQDGTATSLTARLLILADGSHSRNRERCGFQVLHKDYGQTAIICNILTELPHAQTAYERFTAAGPFALLPTSQGRMGMVFSVDSERADEYLQLSDAEFTREFQSRFGRRLGRLSQPGARQSYRISMLQVDQQYRQRVLLLGNAAHTMHPNAAQGFNLALRDVAGLAGLLNTASRDRQDPGDEQLLAKYQASRRPDQARVLRFTDGLARAFYTRNPALVLGRNLGMMAAQLMPGLKQQLMRQGSGINSLILPA